MKLLRKLKKYDKKVIRNHIIATVIMLLMAALPIYMWMGHYDLITLDFGSFDILIIPYVLMGIFYGYYWSYLVFLPQFIYMTITNGYSSYSLIVLVLVIVLYSTFGQKGWFKSVKKTLLSFGISLVCLTAVMYFCNNVVDSFGFYGKAEDMLLGIKDYAISVAGCITFPTLFAFFFMRFAPDKAKMVFPNGIYYVTKSNTAIELQRNRKRTKLSMRLTIVLAAQAIVLGASAGFFTSVLFPDLNQMARETYNVALGGDGSLAENIEGVADMAFSMNKYGVGYVIKMLLMFMCFGLPIAAILNHYIRQYVARPIGWMSTYMSGFAKTDDSNRDEYVEGIRELDIHTHDEIEDLHESLADSVEQMNYYIKEMKKEQELQEDLKVAQRASEAKSSFLSNMSHEIRTPINAVLGLNEMILRETTESQTKQYALEVKSAGNILLSLVNDILDFSKIEAGKMEILPVQYQLSSTVNDLVNMISQRAKDKGLELKVNVAPDIPNLLYGDEIRIKQCVTNVLTNAVKYTEKGSVTMTFAWEKVDEEHILLKADVKDTGIGIKEEDISKLFSPFERIEEIRNRTIEGTGLGMSIVKKLLAMMDTRLKVESVYGEGSDFSFEVLQKVEDWEPMGDFNERYHKSLEETEEYHESFHAPEARILVTDDTAMNLIVIKGLLKNTMVQIDTAASGKQTLELVRRNHYDIIFLDHRMPEMDGIETLQAMQTLEGNLNAETPVIALTANAVAGAREMYINSGFKNYITKPIQAPHLEKMMIDYLPESITYLYGSAEYEQTGRELKKRIREQNGGENSSGISSTSTTATENETSASESGQAEAAIAAEGIDVALALKNCGSKEVAEAAMKEFWTSIPDKANLIEGYAAQGDYRNYTVLVHALKSSARLIGAMELSGQAAYLEQCGDAENGEEITAKTPALLELYRKYREYLKAYGDEPDDSSLPEIEEEELDGALADMKELIEAFDFDSADGIMEMLGGYKIPENRKGQMTEIKKAMADVDRDRLLNIL